MTRKETLDAINNAIEALRAYQRQSLNVTKTISESLEVNNIKAAVGVLLKEGYALGPAGTPCPRCGGSGRV